MSLAKTAITYQRLFFENEIYSGFDTADGIRNKPINISDYYIAQFLSLYMRPMEILCPNAMKILKYNFITGIYQFIRINED